MVGLLGMIGQGLSAAGGAVSQYAGDIGVMQMKAEYEKQAQLLAGQMAMERTQAEQAGATQRTGMEQSGAAARTNTEQAGALQRTNITESGANTRSANEIAGANARSAAEIAGRHADVATEQAGANTRLVKQLAVQGNQLGFADDGNAVVTNVITGTTTPVVDDGGKPVRLQNPAQAAAYVQLLRNAQDDMRYLTQKRGQAEAQVKQLSIPGMAETPALTEAKKALDNIDAEIEQARTTTQSVTQAMMNHARVRSTVGGPSVGDVVQGYRFKGGDPNNKANWEAAQ